MTRRTIPRTFPLLLAALGAVIACYGAEPSAPTLRAPAAPTAAREAPHVASARVVRAPPTAHREHGASPPARPTRRS